MAPTDVPAVDDRLYFRYPDALHFRHRFYTSWPGRPGDGGAKVGRETSEVDLRAPVDVKKLLRIFGVVRVGSPSGSPTPETVRCCGRTIRGMTMCGWYLAPGTSKGKGESVRGVVDDTSAEPQLDFTQTLAEGGLIPEQIWVV